MIAPTGPIFTDSHGVRHRVFPPDPHDMPREHGTRVRSEILPRLPNWPKAAGSAPQFLAKQEGWTRIACYPGDTFAVDVDGDGQRWQVEVQGPNTKGESPGTPHMRMGIYLIARADPEADA